MTYREYRYPLPTGSADLIPDCAGYRDEACNVEINRNGARPGFGIWTCTRVDGHAGRHEAGVGDGSIGASWHDADVRKQAKEDAP